MMRAIIKKETLQLFVECLCRDKLVIAPTLLPQNELLYRYVTGADGVCLDTHVMPTMSAKEFFFESEEELFRFKKNEEQVVEIIPTIESKSRVFIGIRSCDLKGIRFLERFFREPYNDETVTDKIKSTVFVSVGCAQPTEHCFCVCCDGGPFVTEGADAQLVDLGDRYLCEVFTADGRRLFSDYGELLRPAQDRDRREADGLKAAVDKQFTQRSYMATGVKEMSANAVPEEVWELLGSRCMSCGSCTYVCPTCSCFNVMDRCTAQGGARVRTWDSCNYAGFTREVSGHNPRRFASDRVKRRFFHKLSYQCLRSNGRIGCVGCGRCLVSCPSQVDISTFVTTLRSVKPGRANE